jgi:hypothetical protein
VLVALAIGFTVLMTVILQSSNTNPLDSLTSSIENALRSRGLLLFDKVDGTEVTNVYGTAHYSAIQTSLLSLAETWSEKYTDATYVDEDTFNTMYKDDMTNLLPWLPDETLEHPIDATRYTADSQPNIVFVLVDDWGHNDPGYQSSVWPTLTPNINRMAAEGVILTNYYAQVGDSAAIFC